MLLNNPQPDKESKGDPVAAGCVLMYAILWGACIVGLFFLLSFMCT